jgi:hypothetical protein
MIMILERVTKMKAMTTSKGLRMARKGRRGNDGEVARVSIRSLNALMMAAGRAIQEPNTCEQHHYRPV